MLVLNTNQGGGNGGFAFNNEFMGGRVLDIQNSIVLRGGCHNTGYATTIDGLSCFLDQPLLFPSCLCGNGGGNSFGYEEYLKHAQGSTYIIRNGSFTGPFDFSYDCGTIVSAFQFKGGETIGKQILLNFPNFHLRFAISKRVASSVSTTGQIILTCIPYVEVGILRGGALIKIADYQLILFTSRLTFDLSNGYAITQRGENASADTTINQILQTNGMTTEEGDRVYFRLVVKIASPTTETITCSVANDGISVSSCGGLSLGKQGSTGFSASAQAETYYRFNGNNTSQSSTSNEYTNQSSSMPIGYVQLSID